MKKLLLILAFITTVTANSDGMNLTLITENSKNSKLYLWKVCLDGKLFYWTGSHDAPLVQVFRNGPYNDSPLKTVKCTVPKDKK